MGMLNTRIGRCFGAIVVALLIAVAPVFGADDEIRVLSADPPVAERDTMALDVTIEGSGFGPDSQVEFYVTGTCNSGGIQVNWVRFEGTEKIVANITIAPTAIAGNFDVYVRSGGRTGKGTELFRVKLSINSYTDGSQGGPDVSMNASGSFVVVWYSCGQDGDGWGVFGQRFDPMGARVGGEFQVNTRTVGSQSYPQVGMAGDGGFIVVWRSLAPKNPEEEGIFFRRFDPAGGPLGEEFRLNVASAPCHDRVAIDTDAKGNFVAAWTTCVGSRQFVSARRFDSAGETLGPEFQVNASTDGNPGKPAVAVAADGRFLVAWQSYNPPQRVYDTPETTIRGRAFDASGMPVGGEFEISGLCSSPDADDCHLKDPAVTATPGGNFVLAFDSRQPGVTGQDLDASGSLLGASYEVVVAETEWGIARPAIAVSEDDSLLVVWVRADDETQVIMGRRFDSLREPVEPQFQISSDDRYAYHPACAITPGGNAVAVWEGLDRGWQEWQDWNVFGAFNAPACPPPGVSSIAYVDQVSHGASVTLSIPASSEHVLYQWYQDGEPIPTATTSTFTTPPLSKTSSYRVEVIGHCGTSTSEEVTIAVGERRRGVRR